MLNVPELFLEINTLVASVFYTGYTIKNLFYINKISKTNYKI